MQFPGTNYENGAASVPLGPGVFLNLRPALKLLSEAHGLARERRRDASQFALDLRLLTAAGLTRQDVRWMIDRGLLTHLLC